MAAMKVLVEEDGRYLVGDIAGLVGISNGHVYAILMKKLGHRKKCVHWIPNRLTKDKTSTDGLLLNFKTSQKVQKL